MIQILRYSGQLYNYPVYYETIKACLSATKAKTTYRTIKENRTSYATRLTYRTIQTLWQIQLPLPKKQRTWTCILSFSQYVIYVPTKLKPQIEKALANYRKAQQLLEKISSINRELFTQKAIF